MISSTEVRKRIEQSKTKALGQIHKHMDLTNLSENIEHISEQQHIKAVNHSRYFFTIGGLVTKSVLDTINKYKLYTENQIDFKKEEKKEPQPVTNAGVNFYSMIENPNIVVK